MAEMEPLSPNLNGSISAPAPSPRQAHTIHAYAGDHKNPIGAASAKGLEQEERNVKDELCRRDDSVVRRKEKEKSI